MIHVTPINDLKPHEESTTCECCPRVEFENGEMIVIHNSFDGRELLENIAVEICDFCGYALPNHEERCIKKLVR